MQHTMSKNLIENLQMVDGKIVLEKVIEVARMLTPGGLTDSVKAGITKCANEANDQADECTVGASYKKCIIEKYRGRKQK